MIPKNPSPDFILLGAGEVLIDVHVNGLPSGSWRHFGNVDTLELTTADDVITKRSSMTKNRPIRKRVMRNRDVTIRMVGDEFSPENIALLTMGDLAYGVQAATAVTAEVLEVNVPAGVLGVQRGGKFYKTVGLLIGTVTVSLGATVLVPGVDYIVYNAEMGLIQILEGSAVVAAGSTNLTTGYMPTAITGMASPIVRGGTQSEITASLLYVSDNSAGENTIMRVWSVSLSPDGAVGLISADFATFTVTGTVQDDSVGLFGGSATDPLYHVQYLPVA